jgi:hypothetical protein
MENHMSFIPSGANIDQSAYTAGQTPCVPAAGQDGSLLRILATDTSGRQQVVLYDGSGNPLSSSAGALDTADQNLAACISGGKVSVSDALLEALISAGALKVSVQNGSLTVAVSNFPATQAVTEASLDGCISGGKVAVSDALLEALISAGALKVSVQNGSLNVAVSNFPATQAVSGSVSVSNFPATQAVSEASLDGCISGGKVSVTDSAAETSLSTLASIVSAGIAQINGTVTANAGSGTYTVQDTAAETSLSTLAGTVKQATGYNPGVVVYGKINTSSYSPIAVSASGAVSVTGTVTANLPSNSLIVTGQQKIGTTGTPVNLPNQTVLNRVTVKAYKGNTNDLYIGYSTVNNTGSGNGNGFILSPGETVTLYVGNTADLWINGTANDFLTWAG